jgi:hypothetical protein
VERTSSRKSLSLTRLVSIERPRGVAEGAREFAQQVSGSARLVRGDARPPRPIAAFALSPVEAAKSIAESTRETVHIVSGGVEEARGISQELQELAHPMR